MFRLMEDIFFDETLENNLRTYDNIRKIAAAQGDDYTTGCFLIFFIGIHSMQG